MTVLEDVIPTSQATIVHILIPRQCLLASYTIIIPSPTGKREMSLNRVNISLYTNRLRDVVFGKEKFIIANKDSKVLRMTD